MKQNRTDIAWIRKYLRGELSAREMYELERQAQDDPMLMDILMGMELGEQDVHEVNLSDIRKRVAQRVKQRRVQRMVPRAQWLAAASVVLILGFGVFWILRPPSREIYVAKEASPLTEAMPDTGGIPRNEAMRIAKSGVSDSPKATIDPAARMASKSLIPPMETADTGNLLADASNSESAALDRVAEAEIDRARDTLEEVTGGYPTQQKNAAMAAVSGVRSEAEAKVFPSLQGRAAGVGVTRGRTGSRDAIIRGTVTDKETNTPLPGVGIGLSNNAFSTHTDSNGRFTIVLPSDHERLHVVLLGYESQQVQIDGNDSLAIQLEPALHALDEVAVVGYGKANENNKATPAIGWKAYNDYLKTRARADDDRRGTVTIAFKIDVKGHPVNIRVVNGLNERANQQAIELIRTGSTWISGSNRDEEVMLKIRFR